ncbi:MAG: MalY/PatB family protein [Pseudothermotoga sp.]
MLNNVSRMNTDCVKYDLIVNKYGQDVIPAWIADMDFQSAPAVIEAFTKRVQHGVFGYTFRSRSYYETIVNWYKRRYKCELKSEWIVDGPGVVPMIAILVNALTQPGDKIVIQPPVYPPFFQVINKNNRTLCENRLLKTKNGYEMDFAGLEKLIDAKTKLLILSNPHNPVGRVWTREELEKLYSITSARDVIIISDEIHADVVYKPHTFTSILAVSQSKVVVLNSPGKTFNIPGLTNSYGIIPDCEIRNAYKAFLEKLELTTGNLFGIEGLLAAYNYGEEWLNDLIDYLQTNRDLAYNYITEQMPLIDLHMPEATFLMWLDCSKLNLQDPQKFFLREAQVFLNCGSDFGDPNCVRLNIACDRELLMQILRRMKAAYDSLNLEKNLA